MQTEESNPYQSPHVPNEQPVVASNRGAHSFFSWVRFGFLAFSLIQYLAFMGICMFLCVFWILQIFPGTDEANLAFDIVIFTLLIFVVSVLTLFCFLEWRAYFHDRYKIERIIGYAKVILAPTCIALSFIVLVIGTGPPLAAIVGVVQIIYASYWVLNGWCNLRSSNLFRLAATDGNC